ncbi:MAG: PAS domain S-box protein, partial [Anaerolineae bacterium]
APLVDPDIYTAPDFEYNLSNGAAVGVFVLTQMGVAEVLYRGAQQRRTTERTLTANSEHLQHIYRMLETLIQTRDPQEMLQAIGQHLGEHPPRLAALLKADANGEPVRAVIAGEGLDRERLHTRLNNAAATLLRTWEQDAVLIHDQQAGIRIDPALRDLLSDFRIQRCAVLPLRTGQPRAGLLLFGWQEPAPFADRERQLICVLQTQAAAFMRSITLLEALHRRTVFLERVMHNLPLGLVATDATGRIVEVNHKYTQLTGFSRADILGRDIYSMWQAVPNSGRTTGIREAPVKAFQVKHRHYTGEPLDALVRVKYVMDGDSTVTGQIVSVADISAELRREDQLRLQSRILQSVSDAVVTVSMDLTVIAWNAGAVHLYGYTAGEALGRNLNDLMGEKVLSLPHILDELGASSNWEGEVTYRHRDGYDLIVRMSVYMLRSSDGLPDGLVMIGRDMSSLRQTEKELARTEANFRALVQASPDLMLRLTSNGVILTAAGPARLLNAAVPELTGRSLLDLRPREGYQLVETIRDVLAKQRLRLVEFGTDPVCEMRIMAVGEDEVLGIVRDITEQRHAEAALRSSEKRFRQLAEHSPDVILIVDLAKQEIVYMNRPAVLGFTKRRLQDSLFRDQSLLDPNDASRVLQHWQQVQQGQAEPSIEYRVQGPGNKSEWVQLRYRVLEHDPEGNPQLLLGAITHITERKKAEEERQRQQELAEALHETVAVVNRSLERSDVLHGILTALRRIIPHDAATIALLDGDETEIMRCEGCGAFSVPDIDLVGEPFVSTSGDRLTRLQRTTEPTIIADTRLRRHWSDHDAYRWVVSSLGMVIPTAGDASAFICLDSSAAGHFTPEHASALKAFAPHAGLALRNARLYEQISDQVERLDTLQQILLDITAHLDLNTALERIVQGAVYMLQADVGGVFLLNESGERLEWELGVGDYPDEPVRSLRRGDVLAGQVWQTGQPLAVSDYSAWSNRITARDSLTRGAAVGAPVRWQNNFFGVIVVGMAQRGRLFRVNEMNLLGTFARHAAVTIYNARLHTMTFRSLQQLALLNEIARLGTATLDYDELLHRLAEAVQQLAETDGCYIVMWDHEHQQARPALIINHGVEGTDEQYAPFDPETRTLTRSLLERGEPLAVPDVFDSPYVDPKVAARYPAKSVLAAPLRVDDHYLGTVILSFNASHTFSQAEIDAAMQAANLIALAVARAQAHLELEQRVEQRTAELRTANEQLRVLSQARGEFVDNVTHELRTPITSLKLYARLLEESVGVESTYLERLQREVARLESIVDGLLQLARLARGRSEPTPAAIDLNEWLAAFIADRQLLARELGLALAFHPASDLPALAVDSRLLSQVISILLSNALSYTTSGGRVDVGVRRAGDMIQITVADTGPGIPPAEQANLFERFYRGTVGRESGRPGSGLGLSIAAEIMTRLSGTIDLESTPGEGATFIVSLPL